MDLNLGGKPVIEISTFKTPTTSGIRVRDNGMGIDLDKFGDKIFMLYQRFHLEVEGKGMGLHMVKTQVNSLNGSIDIKSTPGVGTTFTIHFPVENATEGSPRNTNQLPQTPAR